MKRGVSLEKLIGLKQFKSKKGQNCYIAVLEVPFSDREIEYGAVGSKSEEQFVDEDIFNSLSPADLGREVIRDFQISNGRAYLTNLTVC